jgi:predicted nucleic acid-binding protein
MISTFTVFFDSNVFFGARLRSLVMELAQTGLFRARWSSDVHREWVENLLEKRPDIDLQSLENTRNCMDTAVLDAMVTGYEELIPSLKLPDENDRHILAAAIIGRASAIVTFNMKHFPDDALAKYGIHAVHPDEFLLDIESIDSDAFIDAVISDFEHYVQRPLSVEKYIEDLKVAGVPLTSQFLLERKVLLTTDP